MNNAPQSPSSSSARVEHARLQQLEQKYTALDAQITDSPVKQALSVLHAMVHEVRREAGTSPGGVGRGLTIRDIGELYRTAPAMEGPAQNAGLAVGTEAPDFALPDAEGVIRYSHISPFLNHVPDIRELLGALDRAASPPPAQVAA